MTTPAEHAATVREALPAAGNIPSKAAREQAHAALDALQAQAESYEGEENWWQRYLDAEARCRRLDIERQRLAARVSELAEALELLLDAYDDGADALTVTTAIEHARAALAGEKA